MVSWHGDNVGAFAALVALFDDAHQLALPVTAWERAAFLLMEVLDPHLQNRGKRPLLIESWCAAPTFPILDRLWGDSDSERKLALRQATRLANFTQSSRQRTHAGFRVVGVRNFS